MNRHITLQAISCEHHHTLSLAQKIIRSVQAGNSELIAELSEKAYTFYKDELAPHFSQEEDTFFQIIKEKYPEHVALAKTYLAEHKMLSNMAIQLGGQQAKPSSKKLEAFAILLKSHTRREERELFPIIESCFTEEQLQAISSEHLKTGKAI